ncbi:hypothetical protein AVEN_129323-1 [Araneus ventricosus]|uniref:Uncharacterized protein n=1 Tax=Araneus ventricosus TaxID=182803 RepID=A0A4Y2T8V2_ARAVE|nr:hypothetical protein AVEN_129323-1 [Araneus ventricosus]
MVGVVGQAILGGISMRMVTVTNIPFLRRKRQQYQRRGSDGDSIRHPICHHFPAIPQTLGRARQTPDSQTKARPTPLLLVTDQKELPL